MSKNFAGQNLNGRSFRGQDLRGADFSGCQLKGCDFTDADLTGAKFHGATLGISGWHRLAKWLESIVFGMTSGMLAWLFNFIFFMVSMNLIAALPELMFSRKKTMRYYCSVRFMQQVTA